MHNSPMFSRRFTKPPQSIIQHFCIKKSSCVSRTILRYEPTHHITRRPRTRRPLPRPSPPPPLKWTAPARGRKNSSASAASRACSNGSSTPPGAARPGAKPTSSAATSPSAPPASPPRSSSRSAPAPAAASKAARTPPSNKHLLPGLARGDLFATVGISHLTTSRRHLAKPVLTAEAIPGGFRLEGMSPWVTSAAAADVIVMAAVLIENGTPTDKQLLIAVPTDAPGVTVADPLPLIGVTASSTGPVHLKSVELTEDWLIAGPLPNVMSSGLGASTGGYETSTLAIGLAAAATDFLSDEASRRPDLAEPATRASQRTQNVARRFAAYRPR